jgi:1-phosphofructokinase/tagatose 6-phosphate kinase
MNRFLAVCLNPTLQRTIVLDTLRENEVNRSTEYYLDAAGKGVNVARILGQLGAKAVHLTHAGGRDRDLLVDLARTSGVDVRAVESNSGIRTCYTLISGSRHTTTEVVEESFPVSDGTEGRIRDEFERLISETDVLIIGGSKSAGLSDTLFADMTLSARKRGVRVLLDIRGKDLLYALESRPDVIKPNLAEFAGTFVNRGSGLHVSEHTKDEELLAQVREKMREIHARYGTTVVLTRGGNPTLFFDGSEVDEMQPQLLTPVNTIGCGDAFTAGFAVRWAEGRPLSEAVRSGHESAALNALQIRPGTIKQE